LAPLLLPQTNGSSGANGGVNGPISSFPSQWVRTAKTRGDHLVDEVVGLRGLLCHGVDGALEDVPFAAGHPGRLLRAGDGVCWILDEDVQRT
jgi:hypothetical protein